MAKRWKNRPQGSNWGDFGPDDQLGRLNLIGQEQVLKGIAEVKEGKTFCLSLPLDLPGGTVISPVRFPPKRMPVIRQGGAYYNYEWRNTHEGVTDVACDDCVTLYNQYSTQWDALCHRGAVFDIDDDNEPVPCYYNGYRAGIDVKLDKEGSPKAEALGIENMAEHCVQGRAVLLDLHRIYGNRRYAVGYDDLMKALENQNIQIETGDIFCFWTGLDKLILSMDGKPDNALKHACAVLNGQDDKLLNWIESSGLAAIASDTIAIEQIPDGGFVNNNGMILPLHDKCLFRQGIHLGELWYFAEIANYLRSHNRNRFFLTAPPLRLPGAVGSPVTPVGTV